MYGVSNKTSSPPIPLLVPVCQVQAAPCWAPPLPEMPAATAAQPGCRASSHQFPAGKAVSCHDGAISFQFSWTSSRNSFRKLGVELNTLEMKNSTDPIHP